MRPKGWENPQELPTDWLIYEAGADAMLEGLKKQGLYGEIGEDYIISTKVRLDDWADSFWESVKGKGYLVFIGEEE